MYTLVDMVIISNGLSVISISYLKQNSSDNGMRFEFYKITYKQLNVTDLYQSIREFHVNKPVGGELISIYIFLENG